MSLPAAPGFREESRKRSGAGDPGLGAKGHSEATKRGGLPGPTRGHFT